METSVLFSLPSGKSLYRDFSAVVKKENLAKRFGEGVVLGFSGGADSVALLLLLLEYKRQETDFPLYALHVHHGIRGTEADSDAAFAASFCKTYGVPVEVVHCDVPSYAAEHGLGTEEAARAVRYDAFRSFLRKRADCRFIATAHHATDQMETVLFRMMRGSGTRGLSGMSPVTDDILRPLISVPKEKIDGFLQENRIPYVTDSTNFSTEYKRNYIRYEILPKFRAITKEPERAVYRMTENLRQDAEFIEKEARRFLDGKDISAVPQKELSALHPALFFRIFARMTATVTPVRPEAVHIRAVYDRLQEGGAFSLSLPDAVFVSDGRTCGCVHPSVSVGEPFRGNIREGTTVCASEGFAFLLSTKQITVNEIADSFGNIYKISIQADLRSAIIDGELFYRSREDGDAYRYGGMNRKVKKLYRDRHVSADRRHRLPLVCDEDGIVWIPGFPVRDGGKGVPSDSLYLAFFVASSFPER